MERTHQLSMIEHNHDKCQELAGERQAKPMTQDEHEMAGVRPWNILMYVRKSDDISEILDALRDSVLYISNKMLARSAENRRV